MSLKKIQNQLHELNHSVYEIGAELENVQHIKNTLGRMANDANEMIDTENEKFFLWDNIDTFQIVNDYLYHVLLSINEKHKKIEGISEMLFDVIVKGGVPKSTVVEKKEKKC